MADFVRSLLAKVTYLRASTSIERSTAALALFMLGTSAAQGADVVIARAAALPTKLALTTFYGAAWTGSQFVVVGESGAIMTSPDGEQWTDRSVPLVFPLYAVAGDQTMIVAVGWGGEIWASTDGSSWTQRFPETTEDLFSVAVGTGPDVVPEFVAVGAEGTLISTTGPLNITSRDAMLWYNEFSPTSADLNAVAYGSGRFKAVGNRYVDGTGEHATILDGGKYGAAWSMVATGASEDLHGMASYNSLFLSVGHGGGAVFSPFTNVADTGVTTALRAAAFGQLPTDIILVGDDGNIVASFDQGASWHSQYAPTMRGLYAVAINGRKSRAVIAGEAGTLFYADIVHDDIFNDGFD
jgi:hypothetical protein